MKHGAPLAALCLEALLNTKTRSLFSSASLKALPNTKTRNLISSVSLQVLPKTKTWNLFSSASFNAPPIVLELKNTEPLTCSLSQPLHALTVKKLAQNIHFVFPIAPLTTFDAHHSPLTVLDARRLSSIYSLYYDLLDLHLLPPKVN